MKYRVKIGGENFLIHIEGKKRKVGFMTERLIEAEDEDEAGRLALYQIGEDLSSIVLNKRADAPQMLIEEIRSHGSDLPKNFGTFKWFEESDILVARPSSSKE